MRHPKNLYILIGFFCISTILRAQTTPTQTPSEDIRDASLQVLQTWYPRVVDSTYGGYIPNWTYDWENADDGRKDIVSQSRHTWSTSKAAMKYPENQELRRAADCGFAFLKKSMWDSVCGGFYEYRDLRGNPADPDGFADTKRMYGNAFAIYALSAYYELTENSDALELVQKTFRWLDDHSRDPVYGGYFNQLLRDGTPIHLGDKHYRVWDSSYAGLKDYNSSIHLMEAYTSLYEIWPDSLLRDRLVEIFILVRDVFVGEKGYMTLFFKPDWTPISYQDSSETVRTAHRYEDHVSFGHDMETAYLLLEAAEALKLPANPALDTRTRKMVDLALAGGWDSKNGGIFESGYYQKGDSVPAIIDRRKSWWVQAESMNVLLLMTTRYPEDARYRSYFEKQWDYIKTWIIDREHGGWYETGLDADPRSRFGHKGHHWKATYHELRALFNCQTPLETKKE